MLGTDIIGIIISYLNRCEDIEVAEDVYFFFGVYFEEREYIDRLWLKESNIVIIGDSDEIFTVKHHHNVKIGRLMNGKLHGEKLPAIIKHDGTQLWYRNDKLHRDGDLPAIILPDGSKEWYINDRRHRENDLPAIVAGRIEEWWRYGKKHRDTRDKENPADHLSPAIICPIRGKQYWIDGERIK